MPFLFILLIIIEMLWARRKKAPEKYEPKDTLSSLSFGTGSTVLQARLPAGWFCDDAVAIPASGCSTIGWAWWAWIACFVLDDLAYYCLPPHRAPGPLVLGEPCEPPFEPALQSVDRAAADMDRLHRGQFHLPHAAGAGRLPPGDDRLLRRYQPDLSILDPHRSNQAFAALVRSGDEHAVAPPRPPRDQPALSRFQLCGVFIIWDRMFGSFTPETDDEPIRYGIVKQLGTFNLLYSVFHEWIGIAKDVWSAPWQHKLGYIWRPPGWSHDGSRDTSDTIKARWREREGLPVE
jgi:hypothetical protein